MYQDQPQTIFENEFYQHLTELIRIFKRIIFTIEDATSVMKSDGDYEHNIREIKRIMQEEEQIVQKYHFSLDAHKVYHRYGLFLCSAYHRFICRLVENLVSCKTKANKEEDKILVVAEFLGKLENCINFHRKERNLAKMFKRIFAYTQKFCEACEMLLSCYSQNEAIQLLRRQAQQEKQKIEMQIKPITKQPPQSQSNFHKVMVVFNKRFATMSCLDLDYNCYKSYCFMSRNDTDQEIAKDFLNRNTIVSKAISNYSRKFSDFLKRKQNKILRKNRFRELKQQNIKTNQHSQEGEKPQIKVTGHEITKENPENKTEESPVVTLPILKEEQKRIIVDPQLKKDQSRKEEAMRIRRGNYQMKNVYLTIHKFHDKFESASNNRFLLNYSLPKPQEQTRKHSSTKPNESSLKSTRIINQSNSPTLLMQQKNQANEAFAFEQMLYQSKMAMSPRVSIIHKCHAQKKNDKRNIRITNVTFRAPNYSKLSALIDPQHATIS